MAFYELVNLSSGNRVGEYDSAGAALRDAWAVIQRSGPDAVAAMALGYEDDQGQGKIIAEGAEVGQPSRSPRRRRTHLVLES